ncbi:MAG: DUF882 domain-containing protein, partial [Hyphomicrobiaceae bacterium]
RGRTHLRPNDGKGNLVLVSRKRRQIAGVAVAALFAVLGAHTLIANSDRTRTISMYNIHTKETISVVYKKDGQFVAEAMQKINWEMRDFRANEPAKMDPALIDLLWEVHTELGSKEPMHIISGYRSRTTNEMLRKTVGGQASESRHILGKAADVHFPDVPLKRIRYSALVRERGGVGYYPTSAIPFVHLDTDRVRSWPRLPRYELALLFPNGKSQHQPADGGPISREDVQVAQARHRELAVQVAEFHDYRNRPAGSGIQVAALTPKIQPAAKPAPVAFVAASTSAMPSIMPKPAPAPQVVAALPPERPVARPVPEPRVVDRPSRLTQPTTDERAKLAQLAALASIEPQLVAGPFPASRPKPALASLSGTAQKIPVAEPPAAPRVASLGPDMGITDIIGRPGFGNGWVQAPAYDEEHPDEMSYRPFPVTPYMTATASADDPALAHMIHPDVSKTLDMLDQAGSMPPMRLRPTQQIAQLMWAQEFKGSMADVDKLFASGGDLVKSSGVSNRNVKTAKE